MDKATTSEEVKQAFEPPKTHNKLLAPFIIVLILAIAGIGFATYSLFIEKDTTKEPTEISSLNYKEPINTLAQKLVSRVANKNKMYQYDLFEQGIEGEDYERYKTNTIVEEFPSTSIIFMDGSTMIGGEYLASYNEINDVYHSVYGVDSDLYKITSEQCFDVVYSEKDDKFYQPSGGCGGVFPTKKDYQLIDSEYNIESKQLTANVAYMLIDYSEENKTKLKLDDTVIDVDESYAHYDADLTPLFDEYQDQLPHYKFIFNYEDGNFIFRDLVKL